LGCQQLHQIYLFVYVDLRIVLANLSMPQRSNQVPAFPAVLHKLARKGTADRKTWKRNAKALKRMQAYGKVDSPESRNVVVAGKPHLAFFD